MTLTCPSLTWPLLVGVPGFSCAFICASAVSVSKTGRKSLRMVILFPRTAEHLLLVLVGADDGFRFNFDQHLRRNQLADFNHGSRRADILEKLSVSAPDLLPLSDIGDEDARTDHLFQARSRFFQGSLD